MKEVQPWLLDRSSSGNKKAGYSAGLRKSNTNGKKGKRYESCINMQMNRNGLNLRYKCQGYKPKVQAKFLYLISFHVVIRELTYGTERGCYRYKNNAVKYITMILPTSRNQLNHKMLCHKQLHSKKLWIFFVGKLYTPSLKYFRLSVKTVLIIKQI